MFASVLRWLRRLGVARSDRRDVAQDVFLAALGSFPTYDPLRARPERWLNKIAVHVAIHHRSRARHWREGLEEDEGLDFSGVSDENPGPDEQVGSIEARLRTLDALQEVEPVVRTIVIAHDLDGIPMVEIAAARHIPLTTAYKWRARGLRALRTVVEQRRQKDSAT